MTINYLCFVLPTEADELKPPNNDHEKQTPTKPELPKRRRRHCPVVDFLGELRRLIRGIGGHGWSSLCHKCTKAWYSNKFNDTDGVVLSENLCFNHPRIFSFTELYIGSNGFSEDELLGSGGFGRVYKAVLPSDGTMVAVKCVTEKGEQFEKTFLAELMAVAQLRHRNLVRLRGWCIHEGQLLLVYEYMPNRSLDQILFRRPEKLGMEDRSRIVSGLAGGLFYLHEQLETQIIHRDVKTSNVMLDSHFNARLGDFGLARWLEHELNQVSTNSSSSPTQSTNKRIQQFRLVDTTRIGGTIGYLSPESFHRHGPTTAKSDVFSFGIVALEVASGRRAVDLTYPDEKIVLLDWIRRLSDEGDCLKAADRRIPAESYRTSDMKRLIHLGLLCSLNDPQQRPTMKWVVEALSGNIIGELPNLPSFHLHPFYISLSTPSNSATTTITTTTTLSTAATYASTIFVTAIGDTMFTTAENGINNNNNNNNGGSKDTRNSSSRGHRFKFPSVDTPQEISYKELVIATDNFSDSRRVAELDFGTAYHGHLGNQCHVLVKRLGMKTCPALRSRFSDELRNLKQLHHRNLVQLRGWCTEQGEMLVVYEYSVSHQLSNLLFHRHHKNGQLILKWQTRYNLIKSLASAILYLHEEWEEQVIHRNITSSAIILDADMNPRLSSFALAEFLTRNEHGHHFVSNPNKSVRGIFGYMSPEYIESGEATPLTDVYSFGVVMLEVATGQMAVDFRRPEVLLVKKIHQFEARKKPLVELADRKFNGEYDQRELERLLRLGMLCTRSDPDLRPSMRQIVSTLDGNEKWLNQALRKEKKEEWRRRNYCSLALIRRIQAIGIQ
ncbi:hypothetical protein Syun_006370 [Stephania yunnanensis]|uniref:Protein kinase domain-containing protein n=1 Tax=Stephania yunnanensis TaxID=152371 RepID=A0AAP0PZ87_9MAGN